MPRIVRAGVVVLLAGALLLACARNPVTGKSELQLVSERQEVSTGEQAYLPSRQSQGGDYVIEPALTAYVRAVGAKLARVSDRPALPYEFAVLNNSVPNAWALPGGKIAINRGLLLELNNEAELAAVLGHEIVHAAARHGAKSIERGLLLQIGVVGLGAAVGDKEGGSLLVGLGAASAQLIVTKYGRDAELESDRYGMTTMARAGYDPRAAIALQETFVRLSEGKQGNWLQGLFASHPPSRERVDANRRTAEQLKSAGELGAEVYQAKIAHLKKIAPAYAKLDEGYVALRERQFDQAIARANEAIAIEPREALFHGLRADAHAAAGRGTEARADYDAALARNGEHFLFYLQRGILKRKQNDAGARADLERSIALLPTALAYYALGDDALARGERPRARQHFSAAAQSGSEVGKRAGAQLARLDIAENPDKYVGVEATRGPRGYVELTVQNRAPLPLRDITVAVAWFDATGTIRKQDSVTFSGALDPRAAVTEATTVGPLASDQDLRLVRVRVFSAEPAGDPPRLP
jgi:predicted Zn-dependent protease